MQTDTLSRSAGSTTELLAPGFAPARPEPDALAKAMVRATERYAIARAAMDAPQLTNVRGAGSIDANGTELSTVIREIQQLSRSLSTAVTNLADCHLQAEFHADYRNPVSITINRLKRQPDYFSPLPYEQPDGPNTQMREKQFPASYVLQDRVFEAGRALDEAFGKYQAQLCSADVATQRRVHSLLNGCERERYIDAGKLILADMAVTRGVGNQESTRLDLVRESVTVPWQHTFRNADFPGIEAPGVTSLYPYVEAALHKMAADYLANYADLMVGELPGSVSDMLETLISGFDEKAEDWAEKSVDRAELAQSQADSRSAVAPTYGHTFYKSGPIITCAADAHAAFGL